MVPWWVRPRDGSFSVTIHPPGDKSISHRGALLGAMAHGTTVVHGYLVADDTLRTLAALRTLGVACELRGTELQIHGAGPEALQQPPQTIDVGNSGTTIRLLAGLLAARPFASTLTGDASILRRPMARVIAPLRCMGAYIETAPDERAPLQIRGGPLRAISYPSPIASAQVKSALLLAGLQTVGRTEIVEPSPSRDHTERLLRVFGASVETGARMVLHGPARLEAAELIIPGDFSSAAFFLCVAAARPSSRCIVEQVGLNPLRIGALKVLSEMGATVEILDVDDRSPEPRGTISITGRPLQGITISADRIPSLLDELPALCIAFALAEGESIVRGAAELRVKESDRIALLVRNLRACGIAAEELPDGFVVQGGSVRGGAIETGGDHRIAMAFAALALSSKEGILLDDRSCIASSYPGFEEALRTL